MALGVAILFQGTVSLASFAVGIFLFLMIPVIFYFILITGSNKKMRMK
jgi:hypothetical protein